MFLFISPFEFLMPNEEIPFIRKGFVEVGDEKIFLL